MCEDNKCCCCCVNVQMVSPSCSSSRVYANTKDASLGDDRQQSEQDELSVHRAVTESEKSKFAEGLTRLKSRKFSQNAVVSIIKNTFRGACGLV